MRGTRPPSGGRGVWVLAAPPGEYRAGLFAYVTAGTATMLRKTISAGLIAAAGLTAPPAVAEPLQDITTDLQQQGYHITEVRRTLLGRIQVTAETNGYRREIVFDRTTGEIRRDLIEPEVGMPVAPPKQQGLADIISRGIGRLTGTARPAAPVAPAPAAPAKTAKPAAPAPAGKAAPAPASRAAPATPGRPLGAPAAGFTARSTSGTGAVGRSTGRRRHVHGVGRQRLGRRRGRIAGGRRLHRCRFREREPRERRRRRGERGQRARRRGEQRGKRWRRVGERRQHRRELDGWATTAPPVPRAAAATARAAGRARATAALRAEAAARALAASSAGSSGDTGGTSGSSDSGSSGGGDSGASSATPAGRAA